MFKKMFLEKKSRSSQARSRTLKLEILEERAFVGNLLGTRVATLRAAFVRSLARFAIATGRVERRERAGRRTRRSYRVAKRRFYRNA